MKKRTTAKRFFTSLLLASVFFWGYTLMTGTVASAAAMPAAPGTSVSKNDKSEVDYSNAKDGYFMVKCLKKTTKEVRVAVTGPSGTQYKYSVRSNNTYEVFPLSDGNGNYSIMVLENVDGSKFSAIGSAKFDVKLVNDKAPFILPNQYVNYTTDSKTVKKAAELITGKVTVLDKLTAVYTYVINNITYDDQKAATVQSSYLPDVDAILASGKGICFDYAAVMTAMLRSQGIPTKLVVGYAGEVYHAWINVYSEQDGWVDGAYFDGKTWQLMDPTYISTAKGSDAVKQFIGDGKNYSAKYYY